MLSDCHDGHDQRQNFKVSILSFHTDSKSSSLTRKPILQQLVLISRILIALNKVRFHHWHNDNRQSELKIGLTRQITKTIEQNQQKLQFSQTARQPNILFLIVKEWQAKSFKLTANQTRIFAAAGNHWLPTMFCALKNVSQQSCCWRLKVKKLSEYLLPASQLRRKHSRLINNRKTPTTWTYTNSDIIDSFCKTAVQKRRSCLEWKGDRRNELLV